MKTAVLCAQLTSAGYLVAPPRALRVLKVIAELQAEKGCPAVLRDIMVRLGYASPNAVFGAVTRLRAMGLVGSPEGRGVVVGLVVTCRFEPIHD